MRPSMYIVRVRGMNMEQLWNQVERVAGDLKGSQFKATTETDAGRNYVELVQKVGRSMLTMVQNECTSLLLFSLARQS
jgi:hypothetical protein